jgi:predicted ATPase/DNA-binding winged helix-turn-helix (wHTH) protein
MSIEITLSQGYRLNRDWTFFPAMGRLVHKETVLPVPPTALRVLHALIVERLTDGGYLSNADLRHRAFAGQNVRPSAVFPHIKILREWLPAELIRYAPNRGYILDAEIESLGNIAPSVIDLPDFPEPLFARGGEMVKAKTMIDHARLLTITGLGGVGKTRFAVALARQVAPQFANGVHFVDLAPVKDLPTLAGVIASALRVPLLAGDAPAEAIASAIEGRRILLVIDTCEYLVEWAVGFFVTLLEKAPRLTILATSQRRFNHKLEKFLALKGLPMPPPELTTERKGSAGRIEKLGAVQLFVERAQLADDNFQLTDDNAADVAAICRQLGGHPLSLELAAARVPHLQADGVRHSLDEALTILSDGPKGGAIRHLSLRATIDWSYGLLDEVMRKGFRRLSIFPAGFTVEGAKAVAGEGAIAVVQLAEHSMLWLEENIPGVALRHRMHEAQLQYAREKLRESGEHDEIAGRFARHLLDMLVRAAAEWETTPDAKWLKRHEWMLDNLPAALDWAFADSAHETFAIDLAGLSARLFDLSGRVTEGRRYAERAMKLIGPDTPPASAARLLWAAGIMWRSENRQRAVTLLQQAANLYREIDDRQNFGAVLGSIGSDYVYLGRKEEAAESLAQANEICSSSGNLKVLYKITNSLGSLALSAGNADEAELYFAKAANYAQTAENVLREHFSIINLGEVDFYRGEIDNAVERARTAASGFRSVNLLLWLPWALVNLGSYLTARGDHAEARAVAEEALLLLREQGGHWGTLGLQLWALIAALEGRYTEAARLLGYVNAAFARMGEVREFTEQRVHDTLMKILLEHRTPEHIRTFGIEGSVWSADRAIEFTLRQIVPRES